MDVVFFKNAAAFRKWLKSNRGTARELWVGFYRKDSGLQSITYPEAVDEALCFGWIDGVRKKVDERSYTNRFSPRTKRSGWSTINIKRVGELIKAGRMHESGLRAYRERDPNKTRRYSYENQRAPLAPALEKRFRANRDAWTFFQAQSPSYQRLGVWFVNSAAKEETRLRRLDVLIDASSKGRKLGPVTGKSSG